MLFERIQTTFYVIFRKVTYTLDEDCKKTNTVNVLINSKQRNLIFIRHKTVNEQRKANALKKNKYPDI